MQLLKQIMLLVYAYSAVLNRALDTTSKQFGITTEKLLEIG